MGEVELEGVILDAGYVLRGERGIIRLTLTTKDKTYNLLDPSFYPYFYLVPNNAAIDIKSLREIRIVTKENEEFGVRSVDEETLLVDGEEKKALRVTIDSPKNIPKTSETFEEFGTCYESDIVFWKRYLIDKNLSPLALTRVKAHEQNGDLLIDSIKSLEKQHDIPLRYLCFDIETYNPQGAPRPDKDPVIMISYTDGMEKRVLTTKKIDKNFVTTLKSEKEMLQAFVDAVNRADPDIFVGYNSSNFDLPYLMDRASKLKVELKLGRFENGDAKKEHHGLIEAVRIPGRINMDLYNVAKFVSVVGASEKIIKVNSFRLPEVYHAITGKEKKMVNKASIWEQWDKGGEQLGELTEYSLADALAVEELYDFFLPIELEMSKVARTTLGEASISTTSQLVEYMLMCYAHDFKQMIPNKPDEQEMAQRFANPYEGAYVKTPEAGIYDRLAVFDFRGLYPSIIITHNIDPSTICTDCSDYYQSPNGVRFRKDRRGITPTVLKMLIDERTEAKRAYKKSPDSKALGARSTALKILANAFYGYLGYARARWYSRECASSITAYARLFITQTIQQAEKFGFKALYSDSVGGASIVRIRKGSSSFHPTYERIASLFTEPRKTVGSKEYCLPRNLYVESMDKQGRVVFKKVKYVMRHRTPKKMYRVWLTNVLHIDVTEDHSLIGFVNLQKMRGQPALKRLVRIKPEDIGKNVHSLVIKRCSALRSANSRNYDRRLYELMGLFVGDGSFAFGRYKGRPTKRYYISIAAGKEENEVLNRVIIPLKKKGIIRHIVRRGRGDLLLTGLNTVKLFESEILQEDFKRIPGFIFDETKENICSFLRGMFTADGTVMFRNNKPIVRYTTIDIKLAEQLRALLWEVGIANSIFKENTENSYKGKRSGTFSYHVMIKSKNVFAQKVSFITNKKKRAMSNYRETSFQKRYLVDKDFDISQVQKVERIDSGGYVYDLEVSGTHTFFANGILAHNTDSVFLLMGDKTKKDADDFLKGVNKSLPSPMELELEDFYTRGVFVGRRGAVEAGAKKKYALLSEAGRVKIRGFELVRRDWSKIARDTQNAVLESILKYGSKEKAVKEVRDVVARLKTGKVEIKDLVIHTQLRKGIGGYDIKSPELYAAKSAIESGAKRRDELEGGAIGYVITKHGGTISEKAKIEELAKDYDADYYINHQVLPATLKILKELGINEEDLTGSGSQRRL